MLSIRKHGYRITDQENKVITTPAEVSIGCTIVQLYKLDANESCFLSKADDNAELWHRRIGHLNTQSLGNGTEFVNSEIKKIMVKNGYVQATIDESQPSRYSKVSVGRSEPSLKLLDGGSQHIRLHQRHLRSFTKLT